MRILVVDDDPVMVRALDGRLKKEGYDVFATVDPKEAVEELSQSDFDLIISDIVMPYISGIELLSQIKIASPRTPIILISALDQKELILTAFELGAQDFVTKPLNLDELLLRISRYAPKSDSDAMSESGDA